MKNINKYTKSPSVTKRFLSIFVPLTVLVGAGYYTFISVKKEATFEAISMAEKHSVSIRSASFTDRFKNIRADLMILKDEYRVDRFLDPALSSEAKEEKRNNLANRFLVVSQQRQIFDQIRILDITGQERIRVNFNQGEPEIVPNSNLQNQSHRYWFQESLKLRSGEVFISPMDLNVDNGKIEKPFKPMIRFAAPIFIDGKIQAIIVLNYLAEDLIQYLENDKVTTLGDAFLLNADGYWLKGIKPEEEWGFMFEDGKNHTFANTFPSAWKQVSTRKTGQLQTPEGLISFTTIYPISDMNIESNRSIVDAKSYQWKLISFVPKAVLRQQLQDIRSGLLFLCAGLTAVLGVLCWFLARLWINREQTTIELQQSEAELKAMEIARKAAEIANLAKGEFLANMNHELRTPLNGILGYTQILQRDPATTEKQRKGLNVIYQCSCHLLTLINDILDLSKLEVQRMDLYPQDFHLANFLTTITEICQVKVEQKGIAFNYQPDANLPIAVHADDKRLRQVLLNLLSNAIKFTDCGSVNFSVAVVGNEDERSTSSTRLRFQVEDTGIGIAPEKLELIFLPFEQAGKQDRNGEGTGLGLAISQQIIQMMQGTIEVKSTPGKGSTFWFEVDLPNAADWIDQPTAADRRVIGYQGRRRKILVIDDRAENRAVLIEMLTPLGFQLAEADNGQSGLDRALRMRPDLILTDVVMSEMNGLEMTRRLRQLPDFTGTPIIASPASLSQVDVQQAMDVGCSSFFPKPIEFTGLLSELQHHLELQWVYEEVSAKQGELSVRVAEAIEWVVPPTVELAALYEAAQNGFIADIQKEANRIKQLAPKYVPFANKLLELNQNFDDEAILNLLQPYM